MRGSSKLILFFILTIAGIILLNHWIETQMKGLERKKTTVSIPSVTSTTIKPSTSNQKIVRKTFVVPGNDRMESIFYQGSREIARRLHSSHSLIEQSGEIPNGVVHFKDTYENTHGTEYYLGGKKHGQAKAYYNNGALKSTSEYNLGKLLKNEEYYADGQIRFEVDYRFARPWKGDKEVGIGKLYYPNGHLKYEWNITTSESVGYKKSYNQDGKLRHEAYFDEDGREIKKP